MRKNCENIQKRGKRGELTAIGEERGHSEKEEQRKGEKRIIR